SAGLAPSGCANAIFTDDLLAHGESLGSWPSRANLPAPIKQHLTRIIVRPGFLTTPDYPPRICAKSPGSVDAPVAGLCRTRWRVCRPPGVRILAGVKSPPEGRNGRASAFFWNESRVL